MVRMMISSKGLETEEVEGALVLIVGLVHLKLSYFHELQTSSSSR